MSFLEYVICEYLGQPSGGGSPCWRCPWCNHDTPSLVVNEPLGNAQIKCRCHRCFLPRQCADEFDIVKIMTGHRYPQQIIILAAMRDQYEQHQRRESIEHTKRIEPSRHVVISPRGVGSDRPHGQRYSEAYVVALAWADLMKALDLAGMDWEEMYRHHEQAEQQGCLEIDPRVMDYWREFQMWRARIDAHHLSICTDPDCWADVCREERGLPLKTMEERQELIQANVERLRKLEEDWPQLLAWAETLLPNRCNCGGHHANTNCNHK